jgi:hypothetical protein
MFRVNDRVQYVGGGGHGTVAQVSGSMVYVLFDSAEVAGAWLNERSLTHER